MSNLDALAELYGFGVRADAELQRLLVALNALGREDIPLEVQKAREHLRLAQDLLGKAATS